jgi:hypothetical protein
MPNYCKNLWEKYKACVEVEKLVAADFSDHQISDTKALRQHLTDMQRAIKDIEKTWAMSFVEYKGEWIYFDQAKAIDDFIRDNQLLSEMIPNVDDAMWTRNQKVYKFYSSSIPISNSSGLYFEKLTNFDAFRRFDDLIEFDCNGLSELCSLAALSSCQKLKSIGIYNCAKLANIEFVSKLPHLTDLELYNCIGVKSLEPLAESSIGTLHLGQVNGYDLTPLLNLKSLQKLYLKVDKSDLRQVEILQSLNSRGVKVTEI